MRKTVTINGDQYIVQEDSIGEYVVVAIGGGTTFLYSDVLEKLGFEWKYDRPAFEELPSGLYAVGVNSHATESTLTYAAVYRKVAGVWEQADDATPIDSEHIAELKDNYNNGALQRLTVSPTQDVW